MKLPSLTTLTALCLSLSARAQGDLTPPGPPAPTMKTLQQIEPRGDVNRLSGDGAALFVISSPGSYFLSGDILATDARDGIRIEANDVSLDLRGFRVSGEFTGGIGIRYGNGQSQQPTVKRFILRNGIVTGWKSHGVFAEFSAQGILRDLITSDNGGSGLLVHQASVSGCVAGDNTLSGINATDSVLSECTAGTTSATEPAVLAERSQLSGFSVKNGFVTGTGIQLKNSSLQTRSVTACLICIKATQSEVRNCNVSGYGTGVKADRSLVTGNIATQSTGPGGVGIAIQAVSDCQITENMLEANRFGIDVTGSFCRIERNHVSMKAHFGLDNVGIRCAPGTDGKNIITLNNITGFDPVFHTAEVQSDAGDHAPIAGFGAPADANYLQPTP